MNGTRSTLALAVCLALTLVALPAAADKVFVDYDRTVDFDKFETFTYMSQKPGMLAQNDLMDKRIVEGIVDHLTAAGMKQVDSGGDIVVTYQVTTKTTPRVNSTTALPAGGMWGGGGWGYGPGWGPGYGYAGGGWATTSTTVSEYKTGSLVVEAYDPETKEAIWRGSAQQSVPDSPKKAAKKIDNSLDKMSKKWHQMHKGD